MERIQTLIHLSTKAGRQPNDLQTVDLTDPDENEERTTLSYELGVIMILSCLVFVLATITILMLKRVWMQKIQRDYFKLFVLSVVCAT